MSKRKLTKERLLLLTLVDLLLQMSFVFFAGYADAKEKDRRHATEASGRISRLESEIQESKAAREQNAKDLLKTQAELKALNGGIDRPPCLCLGGDCSTHKKPQYIADFEIRDDGIFLIKPLPSTDETKSLSDVKGTSFSKQGFAVEFKKFYKKECVHYVRFSDQTSPDNKLGYKSFAKEINTIFYGHQVDKL
ncbi:MAG: hypothetical protein EOP05_01200 [Proteobacteria bacterium]|nr:MAG: hypothetical protein EOP05_01200 [Pseudomonadota bacterium]